MKNQRHIQIVVCLLVLFLLIKIEKAKNLMILGSKLPDGTINIKEKIYDFNKICTSIP